MTNQFTPKPIRPEPKHDIIGIDPYGLGRLAGMMGGDVHSNPFSVRGIYSHLDKELNGHTLWLNGWSDEQDDLRAFNRELRRVK